ncbi:uncharacterized protein K452DRAFT_294580 [Aplosporella prunicola CBS 121167]|uniref:IPT/TIG domain-containing protein n=1 Tax=Aplosporella prunicola CBS 121167 TaxID=1176127 RepID=A0A6A6BTL1_9PEZI|nr:uncharacterized protein K452DRAFT_294580 [Aplosporella prunicola CBS 121167]KAF2145961.1 hypothetical protein K452DRAFT_294580 [Aplosporella prunicola CBS 121167]
MATDDSYVPHIMDSDMAESWGNDQHMFDSALAQDTPLDFNQFLNTDAFISSPAAGNAVLTSYASPAKTLHNRREQTPGLAQHTTLQPRSTMSSSSPESSSQDSASESSGRRKRKMTSSNSSPSVLFDGSEGQAGNSWHKEDSMHGVSSTARDSMFVKREPQEGLQLEPDVDSINKSMASHFDFGSNASSPGIFSFGSPEQTVTPAKLEHQTDSHHMSQASTAPKSTGFFIGSRDPSPMSGMTGSAEPSPAAMFDSQSPNYTNNDMFQGMPVWNSAAMSTAFQGNPWQTELSPTANMQYPGTEAIAFPANMNASQRPARLYIHQDGSKSRVETQITIKLTLDPLPSGVSKLHLPTHTVSKPKLLAKQIIKDPDTLELHTSLVCASAMEKDHLRLCALHRAASYESNTRKSGPRRQSTGDQPDDDPDDPDKPANGGEVRICQNCVQRERKRAARKRVKKQEDEEAWAEYEYERVIVFNDKEYKEWQPPTATKNIEGANSFTFPPGAMQIDVPMRIACYCRHQSEKIGFRVIFTIKDYQGRVVAQEMTQPILITDDHKTQGAPPTTAGMPPMDPSQPFTNPLLTPTEQPDMQSAFQRRPYHSTNDLQGLQNTWMNPKPSPRQAGGHSHSTSTSMTPRNLSRQASPVATQNMPNKKRKSSSTHHHKLPRELTMTRVSTSQSSPVAGPESAGLSSAIPATTVPATSSFMPANDTSFLMQPIAMPPYTSGPPTPGSNNGLVTPNQRSGSLENIGYNFYSVPNSAHHSRAPSPTLAQRSGMNAFQHAPTASVPNVLGNPLTMMQPQIEAQRQGPAPSIYKVTPGEYSKSGGIEVSCLGSNFTRNMEILFGDTVATTTTFWNSQLLVCLLPPAAHAGPVPVTVRPTSQTGFNATTPIPAQTATFIYVDDEDQRICELALRILCQKQTGNSKTDDYRGFARQIVNMASGWGAAMSGGGGGGGMQQRSASGLNMVSLNAQSTEEMLLKCLDLVDLDDSPHAPKFNLRNKNGSTFLSLACSLGYSRVVAGLLARGANPDSRDRGGYTPLMMAAMHSHPQIVRRLILKGADPMMRSLQGYLPSDFARSEEVLDALQRVKSHRRTRSAGSNSMRSRASSIASTHSLWESSPSQSSAEADYEDEGETSEEVEPTPPSPAWTTSRRSSIHANATRGLAPPAAEPQDQSGMISPAVAASMNAWRENIQAQIQQFQQNMSNHWNLPNIQLPALPPLPNLPGYQGNPMMRRISNLVPHRSPPRTPGGTPASDETETQRPTSGSDYRWKDLFSTPSMPPAYEEIYPENADKDMDVKKTSAATAAAEALLDQRCTEEFDEAEAEGESSETGSKKSLDVKIGKGAVVTREQQEQVRRAHAQKLKRIRSDRNLFFIWIPLLLIILGAMLRSRLPQLFQTVSAFVGAVQDRVADSGRVVEVA